MVSSICEAAHGAFREVSVCDFVRPLAGWGAGGAVPLGRTLGPFFPSRQASAPSPQARLAASAREGAPPPVSQDGRMLGNTMSMGAIISEI